MKEKLNTLSIESDGTCIGTIIKDSLGNKIDGVCGIKWKIDVKNYNLCECILTLTKIPLKFTKPIKVVKTATKNK